MGLRRHLHHTHQLNPIRTSTDEAHVLKEGPVEWRGQHAGCPATVAAAAALTPTHPETLSQPARPSPKKKKTRNKQGTELSYIHP